MKQTEAQKRILEMLSDGKLHALLLEFEGKYYNQFPAIKALEKRKIIKNVIDAGYYSRWQLTQ